MAVAEVDYLNGGGGKAPDESAASIGVAYQNSYLYAVDYNNPSSFGCGTVTDPARVINLTLCDYTFSADSTSVIVTAKANVKVRVTIKQSSGATVDEYTISNGSSQTFSRTAAETSGNQIGVLVETFAS